MAENIQRNRGRGQGYKFERGGTPAEFGPYIGVVKNNIDPLRAGRLQVYIEEFAGGNEEDASLWRTVAYVPPFYGIVEKTGTDQGTGAYIGNPQSYGMWFTPPDIGVRVICFFASGDPNQGYYTGCVPELGVNHMIPAVGASQQFTLEGSQQQALLREATQLPVTEINTGNEAISENPKFYDQPKPVHNYLSAVMLQQGLITDNIRGPITSNSQRESPSTVYGVSTPGRSVTQGGVSEENVTDRANSGSLRPEDIQVVGRRGGHSIVLDDGDINGNDNLIRIRTGKGHQITMSDDGDCFYIIHANGQTWLEFGSEGTVDVFSTNSINFRTRGDINFHADQNINLFAGTGINVRANEVKLNSDRNLEIASKQAVNISGGSAVGIGSKGALALDSASGGWRSGGSLGLRAGRIDLNGPASVPPVSAPEFIQEVDLPDVRFQQGQGWQVEENALKTIVSRAPTHEPYPFHNRGVTSRVDLNQTATYRRSGGFSAFGGGLGSIGSFGSISNLTSSLSPSSLSSLSSLSPTSLSSLATLPEVPAGSLTSLSTGTLSESLSPRALSELSALPAGTVAELSSLPPAASAELTNLAALPPGGFAAVVASTSALSQLGNLPVTTAITDAEIIKQLTAITEIGSLTIPEVTSLLASRAAQVAQPSRTVSTGKGVGKYGLTPTQLEQLGLIKTGTVSRYGSDQAVLERVIDSPTIWTGKFGVRTLQNLLDNEELQAQLQQDLMVISYEELQTSGTVVGVESPDQVAALVQSAITVGPEGVADWVKGQATAAVSAQINSVAKNAQQAVSKITSSLGLDRLGSLAVSIAGIIGTVSRVSVDQSVVDVINNAKIPAPTFKPRERTDLAGAERIDISSIQRQARNQAIAQALARGASEAQADSEGNAAGNLAGARALSRLT